MCCYVTAAIVQMQIKDITTWDSSFLNKILCIGNNLYTYIHNSIGKDYLLLSDVPEMVSVDDKVYCLKYSVSLEMYSRYLTMNHFIH